MPTERELYEYLDSRISRKLSCEWDNDGLMCCPLPNNEVKRVILTLDITDGIVDYAKEHGYDTIVSHHPLIFKGIKSLNTENGVQARVLKLACAGITAMSFHTRFDALDGGVNDELAELCELTDITSFGPLDERMGRVGTLPHAMNANELAHFIKEKLGAPYINYNGSNDRICRLAVLGGAGDDFIEHAKDAGADAYLTGELGHHVLTDACDSRITLYEAGHHFTEAPSLKRLCAMILEAYDALECNIIDSRSVKTV